MLEETIHFKNSRNEALVGHYFAPAGKNTKTPVLVAPGTGIPQSFYFAFCQDLAKNQGRPTFIFDYHDIGESLFHKLKDSQATIAGWAQYDIPAALDWLCNKTHTDKAILLGHSLGGSVAGLMHNYHAIEKIVAIAASTGYLGAMKKDYRRKALFFFNVFIPLSNLFFGYVKSSAMRMGEDLPAKVGKEWGRCCKKDGYIYNAIGQTIQVNYYDKITCPFTVIYALDDDISCPANVASLMRYYPNAQQKIIALSPQDYGLKHLGHTLFFKEKYRVLWPLIHREIDT